MDTQRLRNEMVERQIAARGVRDARVLAAMRTVPREHFMPPNLEEFAYEDSPQPLPRGQTISQPYIVALMAEALRLKGGEKVLEIGAGFGYAAAVLGQIAKTCTQWRPSRNSLTRHERILPERVTRTCTYATATEPSVGSSTRRTTPSSLRPAGRAFRPR